MTLKPCPADSEIFQNLCRKIKSHQDVHKIHHLFKENGRWVYIIQTSFATIPNFILGTVDDEGLNPEPLKASLTLEALTDPITAIFTA